LPSVNKYADFKTYVENDLQEVVKVRAITDNFFFFTGYTKDQLGLFLDPDFQPNLSVGSEEGVDLAGITMDPFFIEMFESINTQTQQRLDVVKAPAGNLHAAGAILLGLLVQWALVYRASGDSSRALSDKERRAKANQFFQRTYRMRGDPFTN
jgi:hypothetical protein